MRRSGAVAAAGGALILIALTFDAAPLFVPGVALVTLGVLTPMWIAIVAGGTRVIRVLTTERVIEGNPVHATLEVKRGLFRPPALEVLDPLGGDGEWQGGELWTPGGGRRATVNVVARLPRRGRHELPQPSLVVRDPLDLVRIRRAEYGPADEVLVLPRVEQVHWHGRDLGGSLQPSAGVATAEPLAAIELDGLRPYRHGTPASRIHWAALARGAGLLERRLRADANTRPLVVLDARCSDPEAPGLDAAVRAAASLTLHLARAGGCDLLLPADRRPLGIDADLRTWPVAHARLAVVEGGSRSRPPALAGGARLGRIFYVAAEPPARLPQAMLHAGQLAAVLVLPTGPAAATPGELAFEVAGCRGYLLGASRGTGARRRVA